MIKTKLINKENDTCKFITQEGGGEIFTTHISSLIVGEIYQFQTNISGFSTIKDKLGNTYNIFIL